MSPEARPPSSSFTEMTELVLPQHTNALGTIFGGTVMAWIDVCAAITAQRHTGTVVVTAAVDDLVFRAPLRLGEIAILTARVNAAFGTSLEVEVRVEREALGTRARTVCVEAWLTFVSLDAGGRPARVAPLACATDEERARERAARERRAARLARSGRG